MPRLPLAALLVVLALPAGSVSLRAAAGEGAGGAPVAGSPSDDGATGRPQAGKEDDGKGDAGKQDDDEDKPEAAKARFPQPVQVGQLIGRDVLQPLESQPVLGRVRRVSRTAEGAVVVVVDVGGWFGWGARPVAVPLAAVALLGADVVVVGLTPQQLAALPTVADDAGRTLPPGETIRVGLTKPAH